MLGAHKGKKGLWKWVDHDNHWLYMHAKVMPFVGSIVNAWCLTIGSKSLTCSSLSCKEPPNSLQSTEHNTLPCKIPFKIFECRGTPHPSEKINSTTRLPWQHQWWKQHNQTYTLNPNQLLTLRPLMVHPPSSKPCTPYQDTKCQLFLLRPTTAATTTTNSECLQLRTIQHI